MKIDCLNLKYQLYKTKIEISTSSVLIKKLYNESSNELSITTNNLNILWSEII